jgi:hypothetical protein
MKLLTLTLLVLFSVLGAIRAPAQSFADLKELKQIKIVVEELDPGADRAGIRREEIEAQARAAIQKELPKVALDPSAISYLYFRVITSSHGDWFAIRIVMQLWRPVMVLTDRGEPLSPTLANVRERGTTLTGPSKTLGPRVLQDVSEKIAELAADFAKANP